MPMPSLRKSLAWIISITVELLLDLRSIYTTHQLIYSYFASSILTATLPEHMGSVPYSFDNLTR